MRYQVGKQTSSLFQSSPDPFYIRKLGFRAWIWEGDYLYTWPLIFDKYLIQIYNCYFCSLITWGWLAYYKVYSSHIHFYSARIDSPPKMQQLYIALSKNNDALRVIWGPFQASCPFEPVLDQLTIKLLNLISNPKRLQVTSEREMMWKRLAYIHINYLHLRGISSQ